MIRKQLLCAAALGVAAFGVHAGDLSYSHLEFGVASSSPDALESANGAAVRGSGAISDNFHFFGAYERTGQDLADLSRARLGLGYNLAVADNVDLLARISWENTDYGQMGDGDGYAIEVGARSAVGEHLELNAGVRYTDLDVNGEVVCIAIFPVPAPCQFVFDEAGGNTAFTVGAQYKFNAHWGVVADASFAGNDKRFFIGPRVSF